jgi:large subunit ribosomal protein L23
MDADQIIIEPLLTEKTNIMRDQHKYAFRVNPRATKVDVMQAVRTLFNVHPLSCNVIKVKGKPKRLRYRTQGRTPGWKKAIVTLAANETIEIFEGA